MTTSSISSNTDSPEGLRNGIRFPMINSSIQKLLDAIPQPTLLLDHDEKIISVNINFLKIFSYNNGDYLIGKNPVDIFNCIFAPDTPNDIQKADHCPECGKNLGLHGINVMRKRLTDRCNITIEDKSGNIDDLHSMKVTTSPFTIEEEQFYLFSITDISNDVRRILLENIFFHDVLNKASNIVGILDVLNYTGNDDVRSDELYQSLKNTSKDLISEIKYQRDLSSDRNNELTPVFLPVSSLEILNSTRNEIINSEVAHQKEIEISPESVEHQIYTDGVLLRRVLINMLKNALEATEPGGKVIQGCNQTDQENFRFWVQNDKSIPAEIQRVLFNKSISTKGPGRGIGTFSMRLIGEKYLKGKVHYISSEQAGTCFMIDIPLKHEGYKH